MRSFATRASAFVVALLLAACATQGTTQGEVEIRKGTIEQINPVQITSNHTQGVGAIVGGLGGLGIGSLIGAGTGRDVAMAVGAIGGALIGNEVQKRNDQPVPGQQIIVRLKTGVLVSVTQPLGQPLRVGMPVFIEGSGDGARVMPQ